MQILGGLLGGSFVVSSLIVAAVSLWLAFLPPATYTRRLWNATA